jgi:hypothetical protein
MTAQSVRIAFLLGSLWLQIGSVVGAQEVPAAPAPTNPKEQAGSPAPPIATQPAKEREVLGIHPGSISENIYTNHFFGFSMEIPVGWKAADNAGMKAFAEKQRQALARQDPAFTQFARGDEVDSPLLVLGEVEPWKGGPHHRLIQILSTDVTARPKQPTAEEFLNFLALMSAEHNLAPKYDETLEKVTLGGRELWKAHFTQSTSIVWHEAQFAVIDKKHVVQFILTSPDEEGLRTLEPIMKTLRFENHPE